MKLIEVLAAGVKGAEQGTAELYVRGTSTRASWYREFEAGTMVASGEAIQLDANGGAAVYVADLVDVRVLADDGTLVREFVAAGYDGTVEVISPSFTGTDYTTGAQGANQPTTLEAVLDAWQDSAGTTDWNVVMGGSVLTLAEALSRAESVLYVNVKDPVYGAVGDGATDDRAAIQAAMDAALAKGGRVFFPPGIYRVNGTLYVPGPVGLVGAGSGLSVLDLHHATDPLLENKHPPGPTSTRIEGLLLRHGVVGTGALVRVGAGTWSPTLYMCTLSSGQNSEGPLVQVVGSGITTLHQCQLLVCGTQGRAVDCGAATRLVMSECLVQFPVTVYVPGLPVIEPGDNFRISLCRFMHGGPLAGSAWNTIRVGTHPLTRGLVIGCQFEANAGVAPGDIAAILTMDPANIDVFTESGNSRPDGPVVDVLMPLVLGNINLGSRIGNYVRVACGGADLAGEAALSKGYGVVQFDLTDSVAGAINMSLGPLGSELTIILNNDGQGVPSGAISFGAQMIDQGALAAVDAFKRTIVKFAMYWNAGAGTLLWLETSRAVDV